MPYSRTQARQSVSEARPPLMTPTRRRLIALGGLLMALGAVIAPYPVVSMAFWVPGLGILVGALSR